MSQDLTSISFPNTEASEKLIEKANAVQHILKCFPQTTPVFSDFLVSKDYLSDRCDGIFNAFNAIYSYQRALFESGDMDELRHSNFLYLYLGARDHAQEQPYDRGYEAICDFAREISELYPEFIWSVHHRVKSASSNERKYNSNVMQAYESGNSDKVDSYVDRIRDTRAYRIIVDCPRDKGNKLVTSRNLERVLFEIADMLPDFMATKRFKKLEANSLLDAKLSKKKSKLKEATYYKDYISNPKTNSNYRSLHICFLDVETQDIIEVQIRSLEMHWAAEYGEASHDDYKILQAQKVLERVVPDMLEIPEYRNCYCRFMDLVLLDWSQVIVPGFRKEGHHVMDEVGLVTPITSAKNTFCAGVKLT